MSSIEPYAQMISNMIQTGATFSEISDRDRSRLFCNEYPKILCTAQHCKKRTCIGLPFRTGNS